MVFFTAALGEAAWHTGMGYGIGAPCPPNNPITLTVTLTLTLTLSRWRPSLNRMPDNSALHVE